MAGPGHLTFSFTGLVIGSVIYSMPFVVQPLQNAFSAIGTRPWKWPRPCAPIPGTLFQRDPAAGPPGFITAAILGFAHTVGEFGVVLMIGGNIPTRPAWSRCRSTTMSKPWNMPRPIGWRGHAGVLVPGVAGALLQP
jgi:ABC-type tungstate transport system substrate-binding protein